MRGNIKRNKIAMLLLGGVAVFFMGCEKNALGEPGELVPIHFSLSGEDYVASQVRGMSGRESSETVIVPLDDKYCIYATLAEDTAAQLRDFEEITNKRVMIVVFDGSGYLMSQEYRVTNSNGDIVPVVSPGISVPSNVTYTFVAYSINTANTMAAYTDPLVMGPDADLLWGHEPAVFVGPSGVSLTIGMRHKFSQVTVKASLTSIPAGATLGVPSNVTITPGYQGSLDVRTGVMVKTAAASVARAVEATWTGSSPEFSAVPLRVFTNKEKPVSVTIGSVQVGSVTYSNKVAKFDIALLEGYKYTLTADLKKVVVWAGSNIYWDSSYPRMTFDAPGSGDQTRQGVLFKWGSLIGISPAAEGDYEKIYNGQYDWYVYYNDYGSNTTLYVPDYSMNSWTTSISQNVDWFDISESNVAYGENLSDDKYNTVYDYGTPWSKNLGDICRYISEMGMGPDPWAANHNYRLPTRAEMGEKSSYSYGSDGWTKSADILSGSSGYPVYSNPSTPDGAYSVPGYASNASVVFPASGYRSPIWIYNSYIDGVMLDLNVVGYYWNSSNSVEAMEIRYGGISFGGSHYNEAGSVRCVRAN